MGFVAVCCLMLLVVVAYQVRFVNRQRKISSASWEDLVTQIYEMDVAGLREIADCYLQPTKDQLRIEPAAMWETVGGLTGVMKLRSNTEVMLNLAMYAERWNDANGRVLSEIMRRDAKRIASAVHKVEIAMATSYGLVYLGLDLQEAISSYCLMRARLLGMYGECHVGLLPLLEIAL